MNPLAEAYYAECQTLREENERLRGLLRESIRFAECMAGMAAMPEETSDKWIARVRKELAE